MQHYQLIGYPLGHSMSPEIHRALFDLDGIEADYALNAFPPENFEAQIPHLKKQRGFNITIPYKRTIVPYLDKLADSAVLYGAVNTVDCRGGLLTGYNTDCIGFLRAMAANKICLETSVCVLGAGGAGRMFAIESARQGANVTVAVRKSSFEKAAVLKKEIYEKLHKEITIFEMNQITGSYGLIINATPVGMSPKIGVSPIDAAVFEQAHAVFDCIYNPAETQLLKDARMAGCKVAGGMDMLVWQAAAAHEIWNKSCYKDAQIAQIITKMNQILLQKEQPNA